MKCRIGVDTGGTHTDMVLIGETGEDFLTLKVPTTPEDNSIGVLDGLRKILARGNFAASDVGRFAYGTTVVTNLLIQRNVEIPVGMITTEGFRDIMDVRRGARGEHVYDINWRPEPALIERPHRYGVKERVDHGGGVVTPLDEEGVRAACRKLNADGVQSIAICFLNAYANPEHERRAAEIAAEECPHASLSLSSDIARQFREYERTSSTVVNAFVRRPLTDHLQALTKQLEREGVTATPYIMRANGGLMTFEAASRLPVAITHSGPTAGIVAGMTIGKASGIKDVITFDMGGTSSDVSLIADGKPLLTSRGSIEGWPVVLPMLDLVTVGAGGGSMAWVDEVGGLKVGPMSAGSVPGPACYGQGGQSPTITDANIVLGRLNPGFFLAGARDLHPELSEKAIRDKVCTPLGLGLHEAALGIIAISEAHMVNAVKQISVQRGLDPRDFALVGFGGAGPLHALGLAEELDIETVLIPAAPGNFSAMGQLAGNIQHDFVQTRVGPLEGESAAALSEEFARMAAEGLQRLAEDGVAEADQVFAATLDLCYRGQNHELSVAIPDLALTPDDIEAIKLRFHEEHERNFGYDAKTRPIKLVNLRLSAIGKLPGLKLKVYPASTGAPVPATLRPVTLPDGATRDVPIYRFEDLAPGHTIPGPSIVEYAGSTLLVRPGWTATYDELMTARVTRNALSA